MKVNVCDVCKRRDREALRAEIPTGKFSPDPAGGPSTEDYEYIDMCLPCAIARLSHPKRVR